MWAGRRDRQPHQNSRERARRFPQRKGLSREGGRKVSLNQSTGSNRDIIAKPCFNAGGGGGGDGGGGIDKQELRPASRATGAPSEVQRAPQPPRWFSLICFSSPGLLVSSHTHRGRGHTSCSEMGGLDRSKGLKTKTCFSGKAACRSVMITGCAGDHS